MIGPRMAYMGASSARNHTLACSVVHAVQSPEHAAGRQAASVRCSTHQDAHQSNGVLQAVAAASSMSGHYTGAPCKHAAAADKQEQHQQQCDSKRGGLRLNQWALTDQGLFPCLSRSLDQYLQGAGRAQAPLSAPPSSNKPAASSFSWRLQPAPGCCPCGAAQQNAIPPLGPQRFARALPLTPRAPPRASGSSWARRLRSAHAGQRQ